MAELPDISSFPGILGFLARAGMADQAVKLADAWGGSKRYIPKVPTANSAICKIISLEAALVLAEAYGSRHNDIPMGAGVGNKKAALRHVAAEVGSAAAARAFGCTTRYVRMVRNQ